MTFKTIDKMNVLVNSQKSLIANLYKNARSVSTSIVACKSDGGFKIIDKIIDPPSHEPGIPPYVEKTGEDIKTKKARLLYQSRKRGMLENGLLLSTFAQKYLNTFDDNQLKMYDRLINLPSNDWDIFNWAIGAKDTPSEFDNEVMNLLKKHARNEEKLARIQQPDLYS